MRLGRRDKRVLAVLLTGASNLSPFTIGRVAQVGPARVVLVMARLEAERWVAGTVRVSGPGRRCFYRLTPLGRHLALRALGLDDDGNG